MKTNIAEIEILEHYLRIRVSNGVWSKGEEFKEGKVGDPVRLKLADRRVYFKWQNIVEFCRRVYNMRSREIDNLRMFIAEHGAYQPREEGRAWYRCTYSISLDLFDSIQVEQWLDPTGERKEDENG
jgi:hypothetical protein